jgi:CubicO group peptidase (beta-lactamase class C family)
LTRAEVSALLEKRVPEIEKLLSITQQPGISIGVLYHGETVFSHNVGFRDINRKEPTDKNTLYCIGSLTKAFVTASIGQLVSEGKFSWNSKLSTIIPGFQNKNDSIITTRATVLDILSHRTGLMSLDQLIQGLYSQLTVDKDEIIKVINGLPVKHELRTEF